MDSEIAQIDLPEIIRLLATQQFYSGQNRILSRTKATSVRISGSGLVVHKFWTSLSTPVSLLTESKIQSYLNQLHGVFTDLDPADLFSEIQRNPSLDSMDLGQGSLPKQNLVVLTTIVVGGVISRLRKIAHKRLLTQLKNAIRSNPMLATTTPESFLQRIGELHNSHMDMLENLIFLEYLAAIFSFRRIQHVARIQIGRHIHGLLEDFAPVGSS